MRISDWSSDVCSSDLMQVLQADKVVVEPGDILCLHTGFADVLLSMDRQPDPHVLHGACSVLDGRDERLRHWIRDSQIAALVADNYAVERRPPQGTLGIQGAFMPIHELCLFKLGVPLGELWYLKELADALSAKERSR